MIYVNLWHMEKNGTEILDSVKFCLFVLMLYVLVKRMLDKYIH